MDLPSFIWLWRIAAWSMGLTLSAYFLLMISGGTLSWLRQTKRICPGWLRPLHIMIGSALVGLVLVLLAIGIVGTLGEFGRLGHSIHLPAGLVVVALVLASAWSASRISVERTWARSLHVGINGLMFVALLAVSWSGWSVVQKYLP